MTYICGGFTKSTPLFRIVTTHMTNSMISTSHKTHCILVYQRTHYLNTTYTLQSTFISLKVFYIHFLSLAMMSYEVQNCPRNVHIYLKVSSYQIKRLTLPSNVINYDLVRT